jgi:hypothetical protein
LDNGLSRVVSSTGPTYNLREQLKCALARPEIGKAKSDISRHDANKRHGRKVVALGNHLRTDEDVDRAGRNRGKRSGDSPPTPNCVAIHSERTRGREQSFDLGFESLGAKARLLEVLAPA